MDSEKKTPYCLHDNNGDIYTIFIKESDVKRFDYDRNLAPRTLADLKRKGVQPDGKWASLLEASGSFEDSDVDWAPSAGAIGKGPRIPKPVPAARIKPQPQKPKPVPVSSCGNDTFGEKGGAKWNELTTEVFLNCCKPHRSALRVRTVDKRVWVSISKSMQAIGYQYYPAQLAEKMRNLKQAVAKTHGGLRKHFAHLEDMAFIYDAVIPEANTTCDELDAVGGYSTYINDFPVGDFLHSSVLSQSKTREEEHGLIDNSGPLLESLFENEPEVNNNSFKKGDVSSNSKSSLKLDECSTGSASMGEKTTLSILFDGTEYPSNFLNGNTTQSKSPSNGDCAGVTGSTSTGEKTTLSILFNGTEYPSNFLNGNTFQSKSPSNGDTAGVTGSASMGEKTTLISFDETEFPSDSLNGNTTQSESPSNGDCAGVTGSDSMGVKTSLSILFNGTEFPSNFLNGNTTQSKSPPNRACGGVTGSTSIGEKTTLSTLFNGTEFPSNILNGNTTQSKSSSNGDCGGVTGSASIGDKTALSICYDGNEFPSDSLNGNALRSPPKKVTKTIGACQKTPKGRSPAKSARRKLASQCNLVWPINVTQNFVVECVKHIDKICPAPKQVPLNVWKDICDALTEQGHTFLTWELCRAKWDNMSQFFIDSLIKSDGRMGHHKWPFYEEFIQLHGIRKAPTEGDGKASWNDNDILLLLDCYKMMKDEFGDGRQGRTNKVLFTELAERMAQWGTSFTAQQCEGQLNTLRSRFAEEFDERRQTGRGPCQWRFYMQMLDIFGRDPNCDAPFAASVGNAGGMVYSINGKEKPSAARGTRTKPSAAAAPAVKEPKKKTTFKSWAKELQEKTVQQRERICEEVRLLRLGCEEGREERKERWALIAKKLGSDSQ